MTNLELQIELAGIALAVFEAGQELEKADRFSMPVQAVKSTLAALLPRLESLAIIVRESAKPQTLREAMSYQEGNQC